MSCIPSVLCRVFTLGTLLSETPSGLVHTRHNMMLPNAGVKYVPSVKLYRVLTNYSVYIFCTECCTFTECNIDLYRMCLFRVHCTECCTRHNLYRVFSILYRVFLALGTVTDPGSDFRNICWSMLFLCSLLLFGSISILLKKIEAGGQMVLFLGLGL
jgi:hypothetical protein